ncbi:MAG: succinate dehydrogenase assembly factor 2 [Proteobacteria bacterium]|nr:succinate dehydrogenase assembly factor 2 [Pseudomonadota bacterium]
MQEKSHFEKVRWACRRGMLELDIFLLPFVEHCYSMLNQNHQVAFNLLLSATDPELLAWLMAHTIPEDKDMKEIVEKIRAYRLHQNRPPFF